MDLLLDTHAFLWAIQGHDKLSDTARIAIDAPENKRILSIVSLWEISLKASSGKLNIARPFSAFVKKYVHDMDIEILHISDKHLEVFTELEFHRKDPFDRLMIAQAKYESLTLVSCDEHFPKYDVSLLW
jgi:PIN domain nuclease of toxin-antitoxin system